MPATFDVSAPAVVTVTDAGRVRLTVFGPHGETIEVEMPPFAADDLADELAAQAVRARNAGDVLAELALTVNGIR